MEVKEKLKKYSDAEHCPVRNVISHFSSKWSILLLHILAEESPMRFGEISRVLEDISPKVLTSTLKNLESVGLVCRKVYAEVPPRVEYSLTPSGRTLIPALAPLEQWSIDNFASIVGNRGQTGKRS